MCAAPTEESPSGGNKSGQARKVMPEYIRAKGVSPKQRRAIQLQLQGHSYKEVAEAIGVAYGTVRNWNSMDFVYQAELDRQVAELDGQSLNRLANLREKALDTLASNVEDPKMAFRILQLALQ